MMKTLQIDLLVRVEKANLNAQITEGNITTLKKFRDVDGKEYVYVSATSIKYWLKERMKELIPEIWEGQQFAPKISTPEQDEVLYTPAKPITYIDADLFGYLDAKNNKKRIAPIKFTGLISLYPYTGDIDFGVRYDPQGKDHTLHHTEITSSIFRGTWMILLDWIGRFLGYRKDDQEDIQIDQGEYNEFKDKSILEPKEGFKKLKIGIDEINVIELPLDERKRRLKLFLKALFTMQHFTKQTNFLTDTQPRFAIIILTKAAKPVIYDRLSAILINKDGKRIISFTDEQVKTIKEALEQNKDIIEKVWIVYDPTTVDISKIREKIEKVEILTIREFLEKLDEFVKEVLKE